MRYGVTVARRVVMWVAVVALVALGCVSATAVVVSFLMGGGTGWTFYTPYSTSRWTMVGEQVEMMCSLAERVLVPVAAVFSAIYMCLVERGLRRGAVARGFEVRVGERSEGG